MSAPSDNHKILCDLGALYLRVCFSIWPVCIEGVGLSNRNYDVIGLRASPRSIVGMEVKVTRSDFRKGISKGHFNKDPHITELWLIYPGTFSVSELPPYVGILKPRPNPICLHHMREGRICNERCGRKKNIFLQVVREAKCFGDKEFERRTFGVYAPKWAWKIATSNATKVLNIIEANTVMDWGDPDFKEETKKEDVT